MPFADVVASLGPAVPMIISEVTPAAAHCRRDLAGGRRHPSLERNRFLHWR